MKQHFREDSRRVLLPQSKGISEALKCGYKERRYRSFVTLEHEQIAESVAVQTFAEGHPRVKPFENWTWEGVNAPGAAQNGLSWWWRRAKLRSFMECGGILILVGAARTGKSVLMDRLTPNRTIQNYMPDFKRNASISSDDVPSGLFTIDETTAHNRDDVLRTIDSATCNGQGFCLIFQSAKQFRDYELSAYLANQKVYILELLRKNQFDFGLQ